MIQRTLKPCDKVSILADYREGNSEVIDHLKRMGAIVSKVSLEVGDFICSDRVCVERKTARDFIKSIIDGRLFNQAMELKRNFPKPLLLVEGRVDDQNFNPNAISSVIASIILDFDIPIISSGNSKESAKLIFWLAKREQIIKKRGIGIKGRKKPKELKELQEFLVSSLPGISKVLSRRILEKFKTIRNFVNASESEICKIKGIGRKQARKIREILNEEYEASL